MRSIPYHVMVIHVVYCFPHFHSGLLGARLLWLICKHNLLVWPHLPPCRTYPQRFESTSLPAFPWIMIEGLSQMWYTQPTSLSPWLQMLCYIYSLSVIYRLNIWYQFNTGPTRNLLTVPIVVQFVTAIRSLSFCHLAVQQPLSDLVSGQYARGEGFRLVARKSLVWDLSRLQCTAMQEPFFNLYDKAIRTHRIWCQKRNKSRFCHCSVVLEIVELTLCSILTILALCPGSGEIRLVSVARSRTYPVHMDNYTLSSTYNPRSFSELSTVHYSITSMKLIVITMECRTSW